MTREELYKELYVLKKRKLENILFTDSIQEFYQVDFKKALILTEERLTQEKQFYRFISEVKYFLDGSFTGPILLPEFLSPDEEYVKYLIEKVQDSD